MTQQQKERLLAALRFDLHRSVCYCKWQAVQQLTQRIAALQSAK